MFLLIYQQLTSDVENRDRLIASLREQLSEKSHEIDVNLKEKKNKHIDVTKTYFLFLQDLRATDLAKEQQLNKSYARMISEDSDTKRPQTGGGRAPSNVELKIELNKKERVKTSKNNSLLFFFIIKKHFFKEIDELKQKLDQARRERPDQVYKYIFKT